MRIKHRFRNSGFTLIELVIVMIILAVIATIGATVLYQAFVSYRHNQDLVELTWKARTAIHDLSDELMSVSSFKNFTPAASQIAFRNIWGESILYHLDGVNELLNRNTKVLADHISTLQFSYYDENNQPITDFGDLAEIEKIRCIKMQITVHQNSVNIPIQTVVCPRNFL